MPSLHSDPVNILLVDDQPAKLLSYEVILAELGETLATARMRPLRERITERFELGPLGSRDVAAYVSHRLRRAGGEGMGGPGTGPAGAGRTVRFVVLRR